jgi:D-alanine-D-alanine ligase
VAENLKILILAGGDSEEREVSLATARAVAESIMRLGFNMVAIDAASGQSLLDDTGKFLLKTNNKSLSKIAFKATDNRSLSKSLSLSDYKDCDLVFVALHGGTGEDGTIQALLDLAGMKYTGSGQLASSLAMNKAMSKKILRSDAVPTPVWILLKIVKKDKI